jgi:upstream activation factor subunit UAF30
MATAAKKSPASKKAPAAKTAGAPTGFNKPLTPSAELAAVIGSEAIPRTEVTKKIWEYIKANNLQDAANKRNINADAKLKPIFGKDQVTMFEMTKLLSAHLH